MKKVYLQKLSQYEDEYYIGKVDPRELVTIAKKIPMDEVQSAQRPLSKKRVKEISSYISEGGILPNTLTLASCNDSIVVLHEEETARDYMLFPETEEEILEFGEAIEVMDGQHRLYSFLPDIRTIKDDAPYEMGFTLYINPTLSKRREIFTSCNEKQEKVSGTLLNWFKKQLNMLSTEDNRLYDLVDQLNQNDPLRGHVIMSAEKIKNGVKSVELQKVLKQAKILDLKINDVPLTDAQIINVICVYLRAWEKVVGFSFRTSSGKYAGAAIKISGLRFMLGLLPAFWKRSISKEKKFTEAFVKETLNDLISSLGVERSQLFTSDETKMFFRERSQTEKFAEECATKVNSLGSEAFNPLTGI